MNEGANASAGGQAGPEDGGLASGELKAGRPKVHRGRERCGRGRRRWGIAGGKTGHDLSGDVRRAEDVDKPKLVCKRTLLTVHACVRALR